MKENTLKTISITLDPEIIKKLDEGNYNRSKLIDSLLIEYFKKSEKNNKSKK
jgi:metal-responsive CopG/Arc/MetJ family transcriptional regulator